MEDRAQALNGVITIQNQDHGGTEVLLTFVPEKLNIDT